MRTFFRAVVTLALIAGAASVYADPPETVGRVSYASGAVSFAPADAPGAASPAILNRPVTRGDRLWTDRDGRGEFHIGSTAVRLAPFTTVDVTELNEYRIQLRLTQGTVALRVRELDANDLIEILTDAATVVLREPGSYRITADDSTGSVRVAVDSGQAGLLTSFRNSIVPAGQLALVPPGGEPSFELMRAGPAEEFDRWIAERDRQDDTALSTRYVSTYMTGYEDLDRYGSWRTLPEYGAIWVPARVAPDWAPYRYGHWQWISPWGWTWIDDAPWGFAPFHYGRWVWIDNYWAWAPGRLVRRPVYAPALVAFIGGTHWSQHGPAVGWFPLGWREPFHPWYRASHTYIRNVNGAHVSNVTNNVTYVHRHRPDAVTVVPQSSFVTARPVARSRMGVAQSALARAEVLRDRPPDAPARASTAPQRAIQNPPQAKTVPGEPRRAQAAPPHVETQRQLPTPVPHVERQRQLPTPVPHVERQWQLPTPVPQVEHQRQLRTPMPHVEHQRQLPTPAPHVEHQRQLPTPAPHVGRAEVQHMPARRIEPTMAVPQPGRAEVHQPPVRRAAPVPAAPPAAVRAAPAVAQPQQAQRGVHGARPPAQPQHGGGKPPGPRS